MGVLLTRCVHRHTRRRLGTSCTARRGRRAEGVKPREGQLGLENPEARKRCQGRWIARRRPLVARTAG